MDPETFWKGLATTADASTVLEKMTDREIAVLLRDYVWAEMSMLSVESTLLEAAIDRLEASPRGYIAVCACGKAYKLKEEWTALQFVGDQIDDVETIELRNCTCGSTIAAQFCIFSGDTRLYVVRA